VHHSGSYSQEVFFPEFLNLADHMPSSPTTLPYEIFAIIVCTRRLAFLKILPTPSALCPGFGPVIVPVGGEGEGEDDQNQCMYTYLWRGHSGGHS